MESYKEQVLEAIRTLANENEDIVGKWIDEERDFRDELNDIAWADNITGNGSGSYYCSVAKAKQQVIESDILEDEGFTSYLRDNEKHLEDLLDDGWEALDIWCRCYIMDYVLADEEIKKALFDGYFEHKK